MTPQSHFTVIAPIDTNRESDLRRLLTSMNDRPGVADPQNALVPFGQFNRLHFARLVILNDKTQSDINVHGISPPEWPIYLAFIGDYDESAGDFLRDLVHRAGEGLRQIFSHCQGFNPGCDLLRWMKEHEQPPATNYINWLGRTVRQIHEESALRKVLAGYLDGNASALASKQPRQVWNELRAFVDAERQAGHLALTKPEPTPLGWRLRNLSHAAGVPLILLLLSPLLILYLPFFAYQLRRRERQDPEIAPRPDASHLKELADLEDHGVTNQFSAIGSVKPGLFRRGTVTFILWVTNYATRHIYNRGHLTRVKTIHFARWILLDDKKRLLFASNYDGSLESYMDDFINKVAWGLNLVFSNGVGYPRTHWLILDGAKDEQRFKYYIRRHELPTEVWYNAYPGLTAFDLEKNTLIRQGIERSDMTDLEALEWLKLF